MAYYDITLLLLQNLLNEFDLFHIHIQAWSRTWQIVRSVSVVDNIVLTEEMRVLDLSEDSKLSYFLPCIKGNPKGSAKNKQVVDILMLVVQFFLAPLPPVPWPVILASFKSVPANLHECELFPTLKDFCRDTRD